MNKEKLTGLVLDFLRIFGLYLLIRIVLETVNGKSVTIDVVLRDYVPFAAMLAGGFSVVRWVMKPIAKGKKS